MSETYRDKQRALDRRDMLAWFASTRLDAPMPLTRRPHWTQFGVPAWFKRRLRREHRAKVKAAIRRDYHGALPVEKRDAAYRWW